MRLPFVYLLNAQLFAMLGSLIVFALITRWYLVPQLKQMSAFNALTALLWGHVPRYVTLILFSAQHEGYPISNPAALEAVVGDVAGALLALLAIAVLPAFLGLATGFPGRWSQKQQPISWLGSIEKRMSRFGAGPAVLPG